MLVCVCVSAWVCVSNQIKSVEIRYRHPASPVKQYHRTALDQTSVYVCVGMCVDQIGQMNDELKTAESRFIPGCQAGTITRLQFVCVYLCVV